MSGYRAVAVSKQWNFVPYLGALSGVLFITLVLFSLGRKVDDANISLLYLLIVLLCATTAQASVTIFCGIISFLCYDFFLIPPIFDLVPHSPIKLLDPLAFLIVALVTAVLAERSRQNAMEKAIYQEASQFRATILQLVSHNLRTPLAGIKTSLTTLMNAKELQQPYQELLVVADQECDRLNRLIGNVLQISRLDANAVQLNKDWNALDEVISSVFSRWQDALNSKQLTASIPSNLPLIHFDFELIESALTNLVENAFRHGAPPIYVAVQLNPTEVWITVEDCGRGVRIGDRDKLFRQFSPSQSNGLGLGLAVCKGLVEANNGRLWAEFESDKTRFIISLPLVVYKDEDDETPVGR